MYAICVLLSVLVILFGIWAILTLALDIRDEWREWRRRR